MIKENNNNNNNNEEIIENGNMSTINLSIRITTRNGDKHTQHITAVHVVGEK